MRLTPQTMLPMKKFLPFLLLLGAFSSCLEESCEETQTVIGLEPITVTAEEWRSNADFAHGSGRQVCTASGFYVYRQFLFIVEENAGLHIYDNTDTNNPVPVTFMDIPGGQGLAVRNNILYINQYTDLVAFSLENPERPQLVGRTTNVFEPRSIFAQVLRNDEFVIGWTSTNQRRILDCNSPNFGRNGFWEDHFYFADALSAYASGETLRGNFNQSSNTSGPTTDVVGQGGSLARFTISNGTLYAVDQRSLRVFDLADADHPVFSNTVQLGRGIETIFPYQDKLFIGSQTGMHIYSVATPTAPVHLSTFEHVLSCDPVVVDNDLAYVTLWGGRNCGTRGDQLEIIDVSDARNPVSLQIIPMSNSHGLSVAEGKLFLCAQREGLKVFDLTDDGLLGEQLSAMDNINARDVIALPASNDLIVLGYAEDGIRQFDYSNEGQLSATSKIELCQ